MTETSAITGPWLLLPTYFLSHGGGPWPWLTGPMRDPLAQLEASLHGLPGEIASTPRAILMISGHGDVPAFKVQTHPNPPIVQHYVRLPAPHYNGRHSCKARMRD